MDLRIDDYLANNNLILSFFKNIHPNIITTIGIIINLIIPIKINQKKINEVNILLVIRYLIDIFDGAIARKYNKTSKIGGYLDTFSDLILFYIYIYIGSKCVLNLPEHLCKLLTLFLSLCIYIYLNNLDSLSDHKFLYTNKKNQLLTFFMNNTIVSFLICFIINKFITQDKLPLFK